MEIEFSIPADDEGCRQWLLQQPQHVQEAARLFPLGSPVQLPGKLVWVVGYTPEGGLVTIISNPREITTEQMTQQIHECIVLDSQKCLTITPRH